MVYSGKRLRKRLYQFSIRYPLVYMQSQEKYTIPLGVLFFNGKYTIDWGLQMAALTVATIPPLIVYYLFQKQFIRGILAGALKR